MNYSVSDIQDALGKTDIYLIDQILRGRISPGMKVLDAGCGSGRNISFLAQAGCEVFAVDKEANSAIDNFTAAAVEDMPFADETFDVVICNAVLHFARDEEHFWQMLRSMWRVLKPEGVFFSRLASTIGIAQYVAEIGNGWFRLPDGTERYLVDENFLEHATKKLNAIPLDPLKTTVVQNQRSMTTWVLEKR